MKLNLKLDQRIIDGCAGEIAERIGGLAQVPTPGQLISRIPWGGNVYGYYVRKDPDLILAIVTKALAIDKINRAFDAHGHDPDETDRLLGIGEYRQA